MSEPNQSPSGTPADSNASITAEGLHQRLVAALAPEHLVVLDESADHAGHAGSNGAAQGSHFRVQIGSSRFAGLTRVAKHRLVYDALRLEMAGGVHALAIEFLEL